MLKVRSSNIFKAAKYVPEFPYEYLQGDGKIVYGSVYILFCIFYNIILSLSETCLCISL